VLPRVSQLRSVGMRRRVVWYVDNNGSKKPAACILHPEGRRQKVPENICNVYQITRRHVRHPVMLVESSLQDTTRFGTTACDSELGEFLDCCPADTGIMSFLYRTALP